MKGRGRRSWKRSSEVKVQSERTEGRMRVTKNAFKGTFSNMRGEFSVSLRISWRLWAGKLFCKIAKKQTYLLKRSKIHQRTTVIG
jgi:hypothetical protein